MQLFISSLNSGSNGNCYYVGNHREAVLIDAGLSCRETETRMQRQGLSMGKVKAIFISHEHSDHIRGLEALSRKYQLPVYITPLTLQNTRRKPDAHLIHHLPSGQEVLIGSLGVTGFAKWHDAADPHSFTVRYNDIKVGVFTDIGTPCQNLADHFAQCHAAFLEANYCEKMLKEGHYPAHLKKRISSDYGHLSNRQALAFFAEYRPVFMSHLILGHLSRENNNPKLVKDLFTKHAKGTNIVVASRYEETPVYRICPNPEPVKEYVQAALAF